MTIPSTYNGKSVTTIDNYAFNGCAGLTSIAISNSVTNLGYSVFYNCTSLTRVTLPYGITSIRYSTFYNCTKLSNISIPSSVTSIEQWAFANCSSLTSITIPASVTTVGGGAFGGCSGLIYITLPNSVTSIGHSVFANCTNLTRITLPDSVTSFGQSVFAYCPYLTSVTLPDGITIIGDSMFEECKRLTSVTIPDGVTSIKNYAFRNCTGLGSITIPNSVTAIGNDAFKNCTSLTSIIIPDGVTSIGSSAFEFCTSLTSITIPSTTISIGDYAFNGCTSLNDVYYTGTRTQWDEIAMNNYNYKLKYATLHFTQCESIGHSEVIIPGKAPTCTATGLAEGKMCSVCDKILVQQNVISATGHSEDILPGKVATCTEAGLTEGKKCSVCGEILLTQEEIPTLGHTEDILPGEAATCTETGLTEGKKCSLCGVTLIAQEIISANGHTEEILSAQAATCTETGLTEGKKCSVCGEILIAQEITPANSHTEEILSAEAATCTETGLTEGKKCSVCGVALLAQEVIPAFGHSYSDFYDTDCDTCGEFRDGGIFEFVNYRVVFADADDTHKNLRVEVYELGDQTAEDPTDEKALKAIDASPATHWSASRINKILITDAGNYVLLLKYNVGTGSAIKVPLVIRVSANPKLIIDKNNKLTTIDNDGANINHRVVVYYLGDQTVADIYDEAALTAIDSAPETHWQKTRINRLALTKGGNYVLHLCYNVGTGAKQTVAQQFTVESIPTLSVDINNKVVVTEENAENRNHRAVVYFLGEDTVEDPYDESAVKAAAVSTSNTCWGLSEINKLELTEGGNYVIHLYYNVGTSEKRTLALDITLNERPALSVDFNNKLVVTYTDPDINNLRAYIYNVGDNTVEDIYDEAALKAIATPTQVWGLSSILKKQLTPGTYVIHLYYSVGTSAKKTVALQVTI